MAAVADIASDPFAAVFPGPAGGRCHHPLLGADAEETARTLLGDIELGELDHALKLVREVVAELRDMTDDSVWNMDPSISITAAAKLPAVRVAWALSEKLTDTGWPKLGAWMTSALEALRFPVDEHVRDVVVRQAARQLLDGRVRTVGHVPGVFTAALRDSMTLWADFDCRVLARAVALDKRGRLRLADQWEDELARPDCKPDDIVSEVEILLGGDEAAWQRIVEAGLDDYATVSAGTPIDSVEDRLDAMCSVLMNEVGQRS